MVVPEPRAGRRRRSGASRLAAPERLLPEEAVPPGGGDELLRQRVDDARADPVQAARRPIGPVLELAAGVQRREDDLEGARAVRRMPVDRHAAPVVADGDGRPAGVQRDLHVRGVAVHRLVDRVVEDLPDQVMEARRADAPDVHAGALAHGLEAFEDRDVLGRVGLRHASVPVGLAGFQTGGAARAAARAAGREYATGEGRLQCSTRPSRRRRTGRPAASEPAMRRGDARAAPGRRDRGHGR